MRSSIVAVWALILISVSIGCGGKGSPASTSDTPAPTSTPQPVAPVTGPPSLDGTYLLTESQMLGKKQTDAEIAKYPEHERTYVIKGNTISDLFGRKGKSQSLKLNVKKTPHEIDVFDPKEGESEAVYGIYKLEGDKLTLVLGGQKPEERPRDFSFGNNNIIFVMVKKK